MADIRIRGLTVVFEDGTKALDAVDLDVADGELLVLVGPSGCGKSTLLRCVAGLQEPTDGTIEIGGRDITDLAPKERDVAMVFQSYALYPHLTVRDNLAFGLRLRGVPKRERHARAEEVAELLGLSETLDRRPRALSGGQRQRVAMGRAIVREPQAFLMDEPLSNLDAKLRVEMRSQITLLQQRLQGTMLYVTHDQVEAMTMGHRVAVMRDGRILQLDHPQRVYERPRDTYVASFLGSPAMNMAAATVEGRTMRLGEHVLPAPASLPADVPRAVTIGVRPEHFHLARVGEAAMEVKPYLVEQLGFAVDALFTLDDGTLCTARLPADAPARVDEVLRLGVDVARLCVFDPATGAALL